MSETKEAKAEKTPGTMSTCKNVQEKLSQIQKELFVPKGQKNEFGKYNYRSCEDILVAVKPICEKYHCYLMLKTDLVNIGERYYIKATAELTDLDTMEYVYCNAYAREEDIKKGMDGSQITGAATSYARKYALAGMFCIDNEKDSDATNKHDKDGREQVKNEETGDIEMTISAQQIDAVNHELDRTGVSASRILDYVKKTKIELMTQTDYVKVMKKLNKTADKEG